MYNHVIAPLYTPPPPPPPTLKLDCRITLKSSVAVNYSFSHLIYYYYYCCCCCCLQSNEVNVVCGRVSVHGVMGRSTISLFSFQSEFHEQSVVCAILSMRWCI